MPTVLSLHRPNRNSFNCHRANNNQSSNLHPPNSTSNTINKNKNNTVNNPKMHSPTPAPPDRSGVPSSPIMFVSPPPGRTSSHPRVLPSLHPHSIGVNGITQPNIAYGEMPNSTVANMEYVHDDPGDVY